MGAIVFAGRSFFGRGQIIFPVWLALNVDEDFRPHEFHDLDAETTFASLDS